MAQRTGTNVITYTRGADGSLISMNRNGTIYYYQTNLQGDVEKILDGNGTAVVAYTYDAYGRLTSTTGSMKDTLGQENPFRYRSYFFDQESGFYYLQSRYYDPMMGRFISADSQINPDVNGGNVFAYCGNNPVNMADPDGHLPKLSTIFAVVAAVALAIAAIVVVVASGGVAAPALAAAGGGILSTGGIAAGSAVGAQALAVAGSAAIAAIITSFAENTKYNGPMYNQTVYKLVDSNKQVLYVGRTNNFERRKYEHSKDIVKGNLTMVPLASGLSKMEARAFEQSVISAYTLENITNARREIASGNIAGFANCISNTVSLFNGIKEDELLNFMEGN